MTALGRRELDARPFAPGVLDALIAAIDVNDAIDLAAPLPASVRLDYPANRFVDGFRLSRQLWLEGCDRDALIAFALRLRRGEPIDDEARHWFKQVRARLKHLRFAFFLYSATYRSPAMLSLLTLVMGELQDASRVGDAGKVRAQANRLRWLLARPIWPFVKREFDRLVPGDTAGFRRFTLSQVASLRPILTTPEVGAHAFHAARKVVSRQVSFHDDMRTLHPSTEHREMARWLATLNGLMGRVHDDLVARTAAGTFDYARDTFVLDHDIATLIEALIGLYFGTSSSYPSSA